MGVLGSIGALAGGFNSTFAPLLQQYQQDSAVGQGLYALAGVPLPQQGGTSPLGAPPNVSMAPAAPQQTFGQGGVAQSPIPVPQAVQPSALPRGQPMNPSGGQSLPVPGASQPPQGGTVQPSQTQQPQLPQQSQVVQNQQPKGPDLSMHNGMYDLPTMLNNLVRQPGMTPQKLGRIANSRAFEAMMNNQGLQQYRMLGLGLRQEGLNIQQDRLAQQADEFGKREERIKENEKESRDFRGNMATSAAALGVAKLKAAKALDDISKQVQAGTMTPQEGDKRSKQIRDDLDKQTGDVINQIKSFGAGGESSSSSSDASAVEEAKSAIAAGRNRQMVIERFKKLHPDLDASGL